MMVQFLDSDSDKIGNIIPYNKTLFYSELSFHLPWIPFLIWVSRFSKFPIIF